MNSSVPDRRRDKRLGLMLPVRFATKPGETFSPHEGVTQNVSSGGVYFEAPVRHMKPNDTLWVRIGVPAHQGDDRQNLTLCGAGVVRRVEKLSRDTARNAWDDEHLDGGVYGIAIQFAQRPTIQLKSFEQLLWEDGHH
jgi:hypothetical protein